MSKSRKISKEEKLAIVKRCLFGEFGVCEAGRQMGVNQESIRRWIHRYEAEGEAGFTAAQGWRKYPKELKEAAVKDYLSGKGSLEEICKKYKIRSIHPLQNWITVYNGHKELRTSTGGSYMTKARKTTFEERGYQITWYTQFDGVSQQAKSLDDQEIHKTKWYCLLKLSDELPIFRGFGQTQAEARRNVCKVAYDYLCKKGLWLSIRDEIDDPNKEDAINQLEILARRGYFSIPTYEFGQTYDKDGNPIWKSVCHIAEKSKSFSAKSSSKKDAKKSAAFKMLQYILKD